MIREINYQDKNEMSNVQSLLIEAIPHSKDYIIESLNLLSNIESMCQHTKESDLIDSSFFGFFEKEKLIAVCGLYSLQEDFKNSEWINWFAVDEKYRLLGIARHMFLFLESEVKKKNKLFLKVYTTLPSKVSFWLSFAEYYKQEYDDGLQYYYFRKEISL